MRLQAWHSESDSKLVLVYADKRVHDQLVATGVAGLLGPENIYESDEWIGSTVVRAHEDANAWINEHLSGKE